MEKLLEAEHMELLKEGISNLLELLPKQVQEYLRQEQLKRKHTSTTLC